MGLYVVNQENPYFKRGTFIRRFDDGWERANMTQEGNRAVIRNYGGVVIPLSVDMARFALPVSNYLQPESIHKQRRILVL